MTARKHDGFRILARKDGNPVKLITRNGYDFADRFPLIVDGIASLPMETCIIDGEAIVVDQAVAVMGHVERDAVGRWRKDAACVPR